jgi:hypothetical protein
LIPANLLVLLYAEPQYPELSIGVLDGHEMVWCRLFDGEMLKFDVRLK